MKPNLIVSLLIFTLLISCKNVGEKSKTTTKIYGGAIGNSLKIFMRLNEIGDSLTGEYYYKNTGIVFQIKGNANNDTITLNEFNKDGTLTGIFKGKIKGTVIVGYWSMLNSEKKTFFIIKETDKLYSSKLPTRKSKSNVTVNTISMVNERIDSCGPFVSIGMYYPQISGISNQDVQKKINDVIKPSVYSNEKILTSILNSLKKSCKDRLDTFDISLLTKKIISINFSGSYLSGEEIYYDKIYYNPTIELSSGRIVSFDDIVPADKADLFSKLVNDIADKDEILRAFCPLNITDSPSFYFNEEGLVIELYQDSPVREELSIPKGFPFEITIPYEKLKDINAQLVTRYNE
jgi:hypothetical protein